MTFVFIILFSSCEDDTSLVGIRRLASAATVTYVELDLPSTVVLLDSVATYNDPNSSLPDRLLIGRYTDNEFGKIEANAFSQFRLISAVPIVPDGATSIGLDSAILTLSLDYYYYGTRSISANRISIHELDDPIITSNMYFNSSSVAHKTTPIAQRDITISPDRLDDHQKKNSDSDQSNNVLDTLNFKLDGLFSQGLFQYILDNPASSRDFVIFKNVYKGLAFISDASDNKVIGISTVNDGQQYLTQLNLYYHYNDQNGQLIKSRVLFSLNSSNAVQGFHQIKSDRSGTPLQGLTLPNSDYFPTNGKRYVQPASGVTTKIDFTPILEYFKDTVKNAVFNSALIELGKVESSDLAAPLECKLRLMNSSNRIQNTKKNLFNTGFEFSLLREGARDEGGFSILGDDQNALTFSLAKDDNNEIRLTGNIASFIQTMYDRAQNSSGFVWYALYPSSPAGSKSVNRFVTEGHTFKIKLFYTKPSRQLSN